MNSRFREYRSRIENRLATNAGNCGTGDGGFQKGNTCAVGGDGAKYTVKSGYTLKNGVPATAEEHMAHMASLGKKWAIKKMASMPAASNPARISTQPAAVESSNSAAKLASKIGGGSPARFVGGQVDSDPDVGRIALRGELQSGKDKIKIPMRDGECHWNTAKLYEEGKIDAVVIGYAKHPQNGGAWHQHTWGLKDGKVVETTASNNTTTDYFGMKLTGKEAKDFVKFAKENKPGQGKMRIGKSFITNTAVVEEEREDQPWLSVN